VKSILILDDNEERIADFTKAVRQLGDGYEVKILRNAHSMCKESEPCFQRRFWCRWIMIHRAALSTFASEKGKFLSVRR